MSQPARQRVQQEKPPQVPVSSETGPREQERASETKTYDETILKTEQERHSRTMELLSGLATVAPGEFIEKACEALGIEKPQQNDKLTKKVMEIQKKLGFPEQDNPHGIDGKLGGHTFGVLLARYEQLKQYAKRRHEIYDETRQRSDNLTADIESNYAARSQAAASPPARPSSGPEESGNRPPVKASEVALIGDSLTYGYRRYFNINGERVPTATDQKYVKIGKSVLAMLNDFNRLNAQGKLDNIKTIVIFGGANDIPYRSSWEIVGYLEAMKQVMLNKRPPAKVVLVTLPPVEGHRSFGRNRQLCQRRVKEINNWIKRQAGPNVEVVDLYQMIVDQNKDGYMQAGYNGGDGLHLSGRGYKELAEAVQRAVV